MTPGLPSLGHVLSTEVPLGGEGVVSTTMQREVCGGVLRRCSRCKGSRRPSCGASRARRPPPDARATRRKFDSISRPARACWPGARDPRGEPTQRHHPARVERPPPSRPRSSACTHSTPAIFALQRAHRSRFRRRNAFRMSADSQRTARRFLAPRFGIDLNRRSLRHTLCANLVNKNRRYRPGT